MNTSAARRTATIPHPLVIQARVIRALMLRDMRTRFFGHGLGYVIAVLWPLAHIAILLTVYAFTGRTAPIGDSLVLFFSTGLVPTISFMYVSRFVIAAGIMNKPLLYFPVVKLLDIFIARGILEVFASCCMTLVILAILYCAGIDVVPVHPVEAWFALLSSFLVGFGVGILVGLVSMAAPMLSVGYLLLSVVIYVSSGVLFFPSSLPASAQYALSWNPIFHAVEWMRIAYFQGYQSDLLDKVYLLQCGFGSLFFGLFAERLIRGKLVGG